jgi:hypothetical protein
MDFKFKGRPLTQKETNTFITLGMSKDKDQPLDKEDTLFGVLLKDEPLAQILLKRIKVFKLPFMISAMFFLMSVSTGFTNPGKVIMLLWLAHQYHNKAHHRNITLLGVNEWVDIFPFGVPTEKELERMWKSQKAPGAPSGNLLDDIRTWHPDPI